MNARDFYEEWKDCLRYVHPNGWGGMHEVEMEIIDSKIILKFENRKIELDFKKDDEPSPPPFDF